MCGSVAYDPVANTLSKSEAEEEEAMIIILIIPML